jgi:predicted permease
MSILDRIRGRVRRPFEREPRRDVADELAFHLEQRVQEYVSRGMAPDAARAAAMDRFGNVTKVESECTALLEADRRAEHRRDWFDDLRQDLRFGMRSAIRSPLFSALAILTLALGIGANAAVYGVLKSVLLNPLPYADADRLVRVYSRFPDGESRQVPVTAAAIVDIGSRQRTFTRVAGFRASLMDLAFTGDGGTHALSGALVGPGFFQTLGVAPHLGRTLADADAEPGSPEVVVLSHEAWQRLFGGDRSVLGRTMRLNGSPHEVVGVLPAGFVGPIGKADLWVPEDLMLRGRDPVRWRRLMWYGMIGRLAPGVTLESAERELASIGTDLAREHPATEPDRSYTAVPLRDDLVGDTRTPLIVLMTSAALVLVITCANLAGALLSRTLSRRKEFALREALGAGRGRLVRQLLTECAMLALIGGAIGLLLAQLGLATLRELSIGMLPAYATLTLDGGAVLMTAVFAVGTALAFGLAPAMAAGRGDPQRTLRDESRTTSEGPRARRLRGLLVAGQIAMAMSLLAGAGLLVRSLLAMTSAPLGFTPEGVLTVGIQLPSGTYGSNEQVVAMLGRLEERLRSLPGVSSVASTSELPKPSMSSNDIWAEGVERPDNGGTRLAGYASVSDDYFRTMGIALLRGRTFGATDGPSTPRTVIVSEGMAAQFWPGEDAIGKRLRFSPDDSEPWAEVIGIVGDVRNDPAQAVPTPVTYVTMRQAQTGSWITVVRTSGNPLDLVQPIQAELASIDRDLPLYHVATLSELLADGLAGRRLPMLLMTVFGVLSLLLASIGVYAMFAAMVAAREREFGVRMALGSSPAGIARLVLRQGGAWMALGLAVGALGVVASVRLVRALLYGVQPFDPLALGGAVGILVICGVVALLGPIRRAARADPVSVLR